MLILLFQPRICHADKVFPLKIAPCKGDLDSHLIHGPLGPYKSTPKRHLDWFSRFCMAQDCDRLTNRQTDRPHYSCNNRLHLYSSEMQLHNKLCNIVVTELVSWSLTSLFSTNMAISETSSNRGY